MLKNYLIVALRNLNRSKTFSFLNTVGLALGLSACFLIIHYVNYERSYDTNQPNSDRIYRLIYERTDESGAAVKFASCCPPAAAQIRGNYPEVEKIGRLFHYRANISYEETVFTEEHIFFAEPELFSVLDIKPIRGNPATALNENNRAFISKSTAERYLGNSDLIG